MTAEQRKQWQAIVERARKARSSPYGIFYEFYEFPVPAELLLAVEEERRRLQALEERE